MSASQGQHGSPVQQLKHLTHVERRWLEWGFEGGGVLLHLVQEYVRHLGHLDVVSALCGGFVGE